MERTIDVIRQLDQLNPWVKMSIDLFKNTPYLDNILDIYPYQIARPNRIDADIRRSVLMAHSSRNTDLLITLLSTLVKFPYEDPIWYTLNLIEDGFNLNPRQKERISESLYSMTSEELVVRIESPPKLNTTTGPMFTDWLNSKYASLPKDDFINSTEGIFVLRATEIEAKDFVINILDTPVEKRPDIVIKVNSQYIIGEAKWIGSVGGNQDKSVREVLSFCSFQRGTVRRIGVVDGYIWATHNRDGQLINSQGAVLIQESTNDIMSALILQEYLNQFT